MRWDEWRGAMDGRPTLWVRHLLCGRGLHVDLHKMVATDDPECFHTHPAYAVRVVLWGGYVEELESGRHRTWRPGMAGIVAPACSHRIAALRNGRASYSLWIRFRRHAPIILGGRGWQNQAQIYRAPGHGDRGGTDRGGGDMSDEDCMGTRQECERDLLSAWHELAHVGAGGARREDARRRLFDAAHVLGWHLARLEREPAAPQLRKVIVPADVFCPYCGARHIDQTRGGERWDRRAHTTHRCQANGCGRDFDVYVSGAGPCSS